MLIRKCEKDDIENTARFYIRVVNRMMETNTNYPKWRSDYPDLHSVVSAFESGSQYICIVDGKIAGAFVLNDDPGGAYENGDWSVQLESGQYRVIHTLAVDESLRGSGIAARIVGYCLESSRKDGYRAVRVDVVPENFPAERLYTKLGFRFAGEKDLCRGIADIPLFRLFEYNFQ